jgi:aryl-phospho-beta-D-glucosidase BglC (GH1 family)
MTDSPHSSLRLVCKPGYWNVIKDPYDLYAPSDLNISHKYVNFALDMAEKYELDILVDLHGAPGSQNGQDHSGEYFYMRIMSALCL